MFFFSFLREQDAVQVCKKSCSSKVPAAEPVELIIYSTSESETFITEKEIVFNLRVCSSARSLLYMALFLDSQSEVFILFLILQIELFSLLTLGRSWKAFKISFL